MKFLIIGDASDRWVKEYIENVLLGSHKIEIASIGNTKYKEWYKLNDISVHLLRKTSKFSSRIPILRTILYIINLRRKIRETNADLIILIYSNWINILSFYKLSQNKNSIFWYIGSDLLRTSSFILKLVKRVVYETKSVFVINREMKTVFERIYPDYKGEIKIIDFGYSHLKNIDKIDENSIAFREEYFRQNLDNKIVVCIGYNACDSQQVDKVLESFFKLSPETKERIYVVIPMQYGKSSLKYRDRIEQIINDLHINHVILTEYFDGDMMAKFVRSTDIFINAQTTDAMSGALIEHLYGGSVVISASWLKYSILDEMNIFYSSFDRFEELPIVLTDVINRFSEYKDYASNNHSRMIDKFDWNECKNRFQEMLINFFEK